SPARDIAILSGCRPCMQTVGGEPRRRGTAFGFSSCRPNGLSSWRGTEASNNSVFRPFRAGGGFSAKRPRAMPWGDMLRPFRASGYTIPGRSPGNVVCGLLPPRGDNKPAQGIALGTYGFFPPRGTNKPVQGIALGTLR